MSKKSMRKKLGKRVFVNVTTMNLVSEGFSTRRARKWALKTYKLRKSTSRYSNREVRLAYNEGFFPSQLETLQVSAPEYGKLITAKDYELLGGLNGTIGKRMSNKLGLYRKFKDFREYLPTYYFSGIRRKGTMRIRPITDETVMVVAIEDVLDTLKEKGTLRVCNLRGRANSLLVFKDGTFFLDEKEIECEELIKLLVTSPFDYVITEDVQPKDAFSGMLLRVLILNEEGSRPYVGNAELMLTTKEERHNPLLVHDIDVEEAEEQELIETERFGKYHAAVDLKTGEIGDMVRIFDGDVLHLEENPNNGQPLPKLIPQIESLNDLIFEIANNYNSFHFYGLEFAITEDGFKIMRVLNHPDYPCTIPFDEKISVSLKKMVEKKKYRFKSAKKRNDRKASYIKMKLNKRRMRRKGNKKKMQLKKLVRRFYINYVSVRLVSKGYITREAKRWAKETYRLKHTKQNKYSKEEVQSALDRGFFPSQIKRMDKANAYYDGLISAKDYSYLSPINGGYSKWINDRITMNAIFKPYRDIMPKCYYQIYKRDTETAIIPLYDFNAGRTFDDLLEMVKEKGALRVRRAKGSRSKILAYVNGKYYLGKQSYSKARLIEELSSYESILVVTENVIYHPAFYGAKLRLTVFNEQGDNPVIGDAALVYYKPENDDDLVIEKEFEAVSQLQADGSTVAEEDATDEDSVEEDVNIEVAETDDDDDEIDDFCVYVDPKTGKISNKLFRLDGTETVETKNPNNGVELLQEVPGWDEIVNRIDSLCRFAPQLEYFGVDIIITEDGFKIMQMSNHPVYPTRIPFSPETSAYLKRKVAEKQAAYTKAKTRKQRGFKKIKLKVRAWYAKTFFPKGLKPYLSIRIFQDMKKDFLTNKDTTLKQKIWAIKHGFVSYRIPQYGITEENHLNYISDFEYKWLRHINNKYRVWMEDKITVKYICSEYNSCFPEYYYHISLKNGSNRIIPMMDCPKEFGNEFDDIVKLVHEKGALALKPDEGSHGDGFYKFSYEDGKYFLNHAEATLDDVRRILNDVNNQYLVTEYIDMHHEIKRIYAGAVNTIRMIVFKKDGVNPVIGNAYMRFGSKRTGAVDNMGAGGMFAQIDIETGRFYNAKIIEANEIKPCLHHPDTGVMIDGYLPNWEKVKADVLNVARNIPQLEYFGFDLALTEDGLKFPEINRFPDYPAIEKYTPETIDYLLYKLEQKKKKYGYDVNRGKQLIKLPKR